MDDDPAVSDAELRQQVHDLSDSVAANRADLDALESRADEDRDRIDTLEVRADIDRAIIAELQADGVLSRQHAAHLEEALRSSRKIGAALGVVMVNRGVGEEDAFAILSKASQQTNRKVRDLAKEIVHTGDVSALPGS